MEALHRAVSFYNPQIRDIPRLFIVDICEGPRDRQVSSSQSSWAPQTGRALQAGRNNRSSASPPILSMNRSSHFMRTNVSRETLRSMSSERGSFSKNPDHNLAMICASNSGYLSGLAQSIGSSLISLFIESVKRNIEENEEKRLADLLENVQEQMHRRGCSYPSLTLNGRTRNIIIVTNDNW